MNPEDMFYVMKDSTCCLNEKNCNIVFNNMCHTLYSKWNIEKSLLVKLMEKFGHTFMENCGECGEEFEWGEGEVCPVCNKID